MPDRARAELSCRVFPNPFHGHTVISYRISEYCQVMLNIYDIQGRRISRLMDKTQQPGTYRVTFDAAELPSGVYFYRLQAGERLTEGKMIVLD